ncbi:hypothetical protein BS623_08735 [Vibrio parahaemolyticus]|uniref:Uncharacterized protein n=1 Tax=Vibrio parahaemolyticus TaxID=670 RepID=A0AAW3ITN0_VIBPH|nr:hypothetical protein [Vibrio parahaemolyticus]EGQ9466140.1 hypothetical protein [Vibrio parahaemolyticus]EGR1586966.1 hypothetical protein [Vibrio parahaemolyticus]EHP3973662.1 hypothetical protein [Vibrio parahaemolyticus]EHR1200363.1 hypothetical protein [Vibrio parahaemolyticus]EHR5852934.1 hypothetical protein [Vibrio parahaemolyticus]
MRRELHLNKIMSVFFILSVTLVYFRILPSDAETQPIIILGFLFLISLSHISSFRYFSSDEMVCSLLLCIILTFGLFSFFVHGLSGFLESIKLSLGPLFYIFFRRVRLNIGNGFFLTFIGVFVFYLLMIIIFGKISFNSISFLGIRAVERLTFFVAEPSYLSPLIAILLYLAVTKIENKSFLFVFLVFLGLVTLLSGSVYNFLVLFFLAISFLMVRYGFFSFLFYSILVASLFSILLLAISNGFLDGLVGLRISRLAKALVLVSTGQIDITAFLYQYEPSGSTRLILNYLAFSSPFVKDFWGVLPGGFSHEWLNIADALGVDISAHPVLSQSSSPSAQTYFANLVSAVGFFAVPYLLLVFMNNKESNGFRSKLGQCFIYLSVFFFSFFQLQITNPALWLLIAFSKKDTYDCQK